MRKKYGKIRREKAKKLARTKGKGIVEENIVKKHTKSADIAAKRITDKYKKLRKKKNINIVEEIKDVASKKGVQITAKKYQINTKKMRYKKPSPTFIVDEADVETIDYKNDSDDGIYAKESIVIASNKILGDIDKAETINYVDDKDLADVKENKNNSSKNKKEIQKNGS